MNLLCPAYQTSSALVRLWIRRNLCSLTHPPPPPPHPCAIVSWITVFAQLSGQRTDRRMRTSGGVSARDGVVTNPRGLALDSCRPSTWGSFRAHRAGLEDNLPTPSPGGPGGWRDREQVAGTKGAQRRGGRGSRSSKTSGWEIRGR